MAFPRHGYETFNDETQETQEISYETFKAAIEGTAQNIAKFENISAETKLDPLLTDNVKKKLDDYLTKYRNKHLEYSTRYDQEIQEEINQFSRKIIDAKCAQRWDVLEIFASILCCIPSYILTGAHKICGNDQLESDMLFAPPNPKTPVPRWANFFCAPCETIKDGIKDIEAQNKIIADLKAQGPSPQSM